MLHYSDEAILDGVLNHDENVLKYVYNEYFTTIHSLIIRNTGKSQDAEDIFQDALVIIYQKITDEGLKLECSFKTFLYSIARNLWLQRLEKSRNSGTQPIEDIENYIPLSDEMKYEIFDEEKEKYRLYQKYFLKLSKDCQKVLLLFMSKTPLSEIAKIMGYKTVKYAKTRKFLCKENLKKRIFSDPSAKKFNHK